MNHSANLREQFGGFNHESAVPAQRSVGQRTVRRRSDTQLVCLSIADGSLGVQPRN